MPLAAAGEANVLTSLLTARYISLHTGSPTGGNEVVGNGYARQAATFTQSGNNPTVAANDAIIEFPAATGAWGIVNYVGIFSAAVGGNLLAYQQLELAKDVDVDDVVRFLAGRLTVTAD